MKFLVGTTGYSYKEWKGNFYPAMLPQKDMLSYYSERFSTVEINNTFYRLPTEDVVESWAQQTPDNFRFVLKARQVITHFKRLKDVERETDDFLRVASVLKSRQGPILFQLPPNLKKDVPRLDAFLQHVGGRTQLAVEFRHESWFDDEVFDCLRTHACGLCIADSDDLPDANLARTTNWGYVRLRRESYADEELQEWIARLRSQDWNEAYVFFKHEDLGTGPKLAARFVELAAGVPS